MIVSNKTVKVQMWLFMKYMYKTLGDLVAVYDTDLHRVIDLHDFFGPFKKYWIFSLHFLLYFLIFPELPEWSNGSIKIEPLDYMV